MSRKSNINKTLFIILVVIFLQRAGTADMRIDLWGAEVTFNNEKQSKHSKRNYIEVKRVHPLSSLNIAYM